MATEIELYVERHEGGRWLPSDGWERPYRARNHDLSAMLAGVGASGGIRPIAPPRGFPDDASPELREEWVTHGGHTASWVTAAELMDYDWTRCIQQSGWIDGPTFFEWDGARRQLGRGPRVWHVEVGGTRIEVDEMERRLKAIEDKAGYRHDRTVSAIRSQLGAIHCRVSWSDPYGRLARDFLSELLPRLWRLGPPSAVRIVFWFSA